MKGAESEQPVGAPFYQWVACRDQVGIACFPHSWSWRAQGGPEKMCGIFKMGKPAQAKNSLCQYWI